jgi:MarR family transcriptional regulator for hemolysin
MIQYDHHESVIYWIVSTAHALERVVNEELAPLGMTFRQAEVLAWLALDGPLSQVELADRMRIEAPTLAGIVERMERAEWIVRTPYPQDRRKKLLHPTERVEPVWARVMEAGLRVRARASAGHDAESVRQMIRMLEAIQKNLLDSAAEPSEASPAPPLIDQGAAADPA